MLHVDLYWGFFSQSMGLLRQTENEVFTAFQKFKAFIENQIGKKIKSLGSIKVLNLGPAIHDEDAHQ